LLGSTSFILVSSRNTIALIIELRVVKAFYTLLFSVARSTLPSSILTLTQPVRINPLIDVISIFYLLSSNKYSFDNSSEFMLSMFEL